MIRGFNWEVTYLLLTESAQSGLRLIIIIMIIAELRGMSRQPFRPLGEEGEFLVPKSYILRKRRDSVKPRLQKNHQLDILYIKLFSPMPGFAITTVVFVVCFSFFAFVYATSLFTEKARKGKRLCNKQQDMWESLK